MTLPLLPESLQPLAALFVKVGVSIGGLSDAQRRLALGLMWAGLPGSPRSERDVNKALTARLTGVSNFLDTDHVALRRWLVDAGWLARDGCGRECHRVAAAAASPQTLRSAFAADQLQSGVDIRTVQKLPGHGDVGTTMIYIHGLEFGGGMVRSPLDALQAV